MNQYDNPDFFDAYSKMPRSQLGLDSAGEWQQLQPLFPQLHGKTVLDLGCGYGWHCKYAAQQGASFVLGLDQSSRITDAGRDVPPNDATGKGEKTSFSACVLTLF